MRINQSEICSADFKMSFYFTTENQPIVFAKQSVVYNRSFKLQEKTYLKR